jgi:hypothetical protein
MGVDTISTGNRFYGITLFRSSVGETIPGNIPSRDPGPFLKKVRFAGSLWRGRFDFAFERLF